MPVRPGREPGNERALELLLRPRPAPSCIEREPPGSILRACWWPGRRKPSGVMPIPVGCARPETRVPTNFPNSPHYNRPSDRMSTCILVTDSPARM